MPYSASLAERVRQSLRRHPASVEKKMFGGVAFLLWGNLCVGVWDTSLIARVGPAAYSAALQEPFVREFDVTGRPLRGWILVAAEGVDEDEALDGWIDRAVAFVETLPAK